MVKTRIEVARDDMGAVLGSVMVPDRNGTCCLRGELVNIGRNDKGQFYMAFESEDPDLLIIKRHTLFFSLSVLDDLTIRKLDDRYVVITR